MQNIITAANELLEAMEENEPGYEDLSRNLRLAIDEHSMTKFSYIVEIDLIADDSYEAEQAIEAALTNYEYEKPRAAHIRVWSIFSK